MLTVLIREHTGHERIIEAVEVDSEPGSDGGHGDRAYFIHRDSHVERVTSEHASTLYVMNASGRTVANYHFSVPPKAAQEVAQAAA